MSSIGWDQALAWRMDRLLLAPIGTEPVDGVVRRLCAVPAQDDGAAELVIRTRRTDSASGEVAAALAAGTISKTFAFRGATHLMAPEEAGVYLALRAASRMWERKSWRSHYRLEPSQWPRLREVVREALSDGSLTREELGSAVTEDTEFAHLAFAFEDGGTNLLKALAWQGDFCFGPPRGRSATFQRLDQNPRWAGVPDPDEAGPRAVEAYFRSYGPATPGHVHYWLGEGLGAGRRRIEAWTKALGERLVEVDVGGESMRIMREARGSRDGTTVNGRAPPARLRPVGPGSRHVGRARRASGSASAGQPASEPRHLGRCRIRNVGPA